MALAICTSCNARVHWHASRGARLELICCPVCGSGIWGLCRRHFGAPGVEQELARAVIDRAMYRAEDPGARLERVMAAYRRALEEHRVTA